MTDYIKTVETVTFKRKEEPFTGFSVQQSKVLQPCPRCVNFDHGYRMECFECSRYYADRFQERK